MTNTSNPSIRDDFVSFRMYAMTFAPNKTSVTPNLPDNVLLKYMPTYEQSRPEDVVQMFISEDFLNSIFRSYEFNYIIIDYTDQLLSSSCKLGIQTMFTHAFGVKDCRMRFRLERMGQVKITAGQFNMQNTTFSVEYLDNLDHNKTLAVLHVDFTNWMSFNVLKDFMIANITIGDPKIDYNITAWATDSKVGEPRGDEVMTLFFKTAMAALLKDHYTFNLYDKFLKFHDKLKYLNLCFSNSELVLVDRYISVYVNPDMTKFLDFLANISCLEKSSSQSESWFWKVICLNFIPLVQNVEDFSKEKQAEALEFPSS